MATFAERLARLRSGGDFESRLAALRTRTGATGSWEEPTATGDPRARIGESIWRGVKGAASQLDPSGIVEMVRHPIDTIRGLVDTRPQAMEAMEAAAMAIPGGNVEPSVMDPNSRFDYATKAAKKAIGAIPVVGPIAEGITDSITGSIAEGDVAGAIGKGAANIALARTPKMARAAGEGVSAAGGRMAARQVGKYADVISPDAPLSESLATKMMERGITGSNPAKTAATASAEGARLEAEAAALNAARDKIPPASFPSKTPKLPKDYSDFGEGADIAVRNDLLGRSGIFGWIASDPAREAVYSRLPSGTRVVKAGTEAAILEAPDGNIVRISRAGYGDARPQIPEVLQPIGAEKVGKWQIELMPKIEASPTLREGELAGLAAKIKARGYELWDDHPGNLGRTQKGELVVIDGGAVSRTSRASELEAANTQRGARRKELRVERDAVAEEAATQRNIQTIMEALPESKSVRNVLIDGAKSAVKRGGAGGIAGMAIDTIGGGVGTAAGVGYTTIQTLREITKTTAFKAASAIHKRRFGEALRTKDLATAAEVGAGILSGALIADDFGHAQAIQNLSSETEQLGSPDLRRQRVTSLRAFYEQPDGSRVEIPRNVMTALASSPRADATASPILAYLSAMEKQGVLKKGGHLEFVNLDRQAHPAAQWPTNATAPDENEGFLERMGRPSAVLPPAFRGARDTEYVDVESIMPGDVGGRYGYALSPDELKTPDPRDPRQAKLPNRIAIAERDRGNPEVATHEAGHAIYENDLSDKDRSAWNGIFDATVGRMVEELRAAGVTEQTPRSDPRAEAIISKYPKGITYFAYNVDDPKGYGVAYRESFAEMWGQYMANPSEFSQAYPGLFRFMRDISGADYRPMGNPPAHVLETKPALEYPGAFNKR